MEKIRVNRDKLLAVLTKNREEHRTIFLKALDGYKAKVIELLEDRLTRARAGKRVSVMLNITQPVDQTKDYDRAIMMIQMSVEEEITLSEHDFLQYVMDDWQWKGQFSASNKMYTPSSFADDEEDS